MLDKRETMRRLCALLGNVAFQLAKDRTDRIRRGQVDPCDAPLHIAGCFCGDNPLTASGEWPCETTEHTMAWLEHVVGEALDVLERRRCTCDPEIEWGPECSNCYLERKGWDY